MRLPVLALLLLCLPWSARTQETVFYRCTDAKGNVMVQNGTPCAAGMKQEIRRIGAVSTVPVPARKPKADADTPPPPPQYGEFVLVSGPAMQRAPAPEAAGLPAPRCAPLQVVGIDGTSGLGMAQACELKQDRCSAVPDAQLCAAWYRRLDEADFKLRYANDDNRRARQADYAAVDAKVKASRCATSVPATP